MGDGHDRKVSNEEAQAAMQPVTVPLPKPKAPRSGVKVDTDHTPTVDGILDPQRPAMDGMDSVVIIDSVTHIVEAIYNDVLLRTLDELEPQLAEVPKPPGDSDFIAKLLGFTVELVATATLTELGGLAAAKLFADAPEVAQAAGATAAAAETSTPEAVDHAVTSASKAGGKVAGDWVQGQGDSAAGGPEITLPPGMPLAGQFVEMQRARLVVKREDAVDMLRVIKASAAKQKPAALATLDGSLKQLIFDGTLGAWFRNKVTMEWLNFVARISLGPRPEGQVTNMRGANTIGGIGEAGTQGIVQWQGGHDGFIEITVDAESKDALSVSKTVVSGRPGAAEVLKSRSSKKDESGDQYTLATMPVFRRIWLKTGDSRLETTPAFVITPEGALEVNYDDPKLAVIGGAAAPKIGEGPYQPLDASDPRGWADRARRATHAMAGAQRIVALLSSKTSENLQ
jgi:hypothetical protein